MQKKSILLFFAVSFIAIFTSGCSYPPPPQDLKPVTFSPQPVEQVTNTKDTGIATWISIENQESLIKKNNDLKPVTRNLQPDTMFESQGISTTPTHETNSAPIEENKPTEQQTQQQPQEYVTFVVEDTSYTFPYLENSTVEDIMIAGTKINASFHFETKNYPGMGSLVTAINGKAQDNKNGYYWIYKINGKKAHTGISATIIQQGDVIEWNYEKDEL